MEELDRYLQEQSGDGQLQSSGVFTQTWEKAMAKLGSFALPSPHHWILKVVQSAVAAGSRQIDLEFSRQATVLAFDKGWSLEEFQEAFHHPERTLAPALQHLRVALWAAGYSGRRPFQYFPDHSSAYLSWDGRQMAVKSHSRAFAKSRLSLCSAPGRENKHSQAELELLRSCACASPIPIRYENVTLTPDSLVRWIQDGVVISQEELAGPSQLFCHLLVSGEGLATDISGFRLVESAEKEMRLAPILQAVARDLTSGAVSKITGAYRVELSRRDPKGKTKGWMLMVTAGLSALFDLWGTGGSNLILSGLIGLTGVGYRQWSVGLALSPTDFQKELDEFRQRWMSLAEVT